MKSVVPINFYTISGTTMILNHNHKQILLILLSVSSWSKTSLQILSWWFNLFSVYFGLAFVLRLIHYCITNTKEYKGFILLLGVMHSQVSLLLFSNIIAWLVSSFLLLLFLSSVYLFYGALRNFIKSQAFAVCCLILPLVHITG